MPYSIIYILIIFILTHFDSEVSIALGWKINNFKNYRIQGDTTLRITKLYSSTKSTLNSTNFKRGIKVDNQIVLVSDNYTYSNVSLWQINNSFNSSTIKSLIEIRDNVTSAIAKVEENLAKFIFLLVSKVDRDIRTTIMAGQYLQQKASKDTKQFVLGFESNIILPILQLPAAVVEISSDSSNWELIKTGINPISSSQLITNLKPQNTKQRVDGIKKRNTLINTPNELKLIQSITTLPSTLSYKYERRNIQRELNNIKEKKKHPQFELPITSDVPNEAKLEDDLILPVSVNSLSTNKNVLKDINVIFQLKEEFEWIIENIIDDSENDDNLLLNEGLTSCMSIIRNVETMDQNYERNDKDIFSLRKALRCLSKYRENSEFLYRVNSKKQLYMIIAEVIVEELSKENTQQANEEAVADTEISLKPLIVPQDSMSDSNIAKTSSQIPIIETSAESYETREDFVMNSVVKSLDVSLFLVETLYHASSQIISDRGSLVYQRVKDVFSIDENIALTNLQIQNQVNLIIPQYRLKANWKIYDQLKK